MMDGARSDGALASEPLKGFLGWASDWLFQDEQPDEGSSERNLLLTLNAREVLAAKAGSKVVYTPDSPRMRERQGSSSASRSSAVLSSYSKGQREEGIDVGGSDKFYIPEHSEEAEGLAWIRARMAQTTNAEIRGHSPDAVNERGHGALQRGRGAAAGEESKARLQREEGGGAGGWPEEGLERSEFDEGGYQTSAEARARTDQGLPTLTPMPSGLHGNNSTYAVPHSQNGWMFDTHGGGNVAGGLSPVSLDVQQGQGQLVDDDGRMGGPRYDVYASTVRNDPPSSFLPRTDVDLHPNLTRRRCSSGLMVSTTRYDFEHEKDVLQTRASESESESALRARASDKDTKESRPDDDENDDDNDGDNDNDNVQPANNVRESQGAASSPVRKRVPRAPPRTRRRSSVEREYFIKFSDDKFHEQGQRVEHGSEGVTHVGAGHVSDSSADGEGGWPQRPEKREEEEEGAKEDEGAQEDGRVRGGDVVQEDGGGGERVQADDEANDVERVPSVSGEANNEGMRSVEEVRGDEKVERDDVESQASVQVQVEGVEEESGKDGVDTIGVGVESQSRGDIVASQPLDGVESQSRGDIVASQPLDGVESQSRGDIVASQPLDYATLPGGQPNLHTLTQQVGKSVRTIAELSEDELLDLYASPSQSATQSPVKSPEADRGLVEESQALPEALPRRPPVLTLPSPKTPTSNPSSNTQVSPSNARITTPRVLKASPASIKSPSSASPPLCAAAAAAAADVPSPLSRIAQASPSVVPQSTAAHQASPKSISKPNVIPVKRRLSNDGMPCHDVAREGSIGASTPCGSSKYDGIIDPLAMALASGEMLAMGDAKGSLLLAEKAQNQTVGQGDVSIALAYVAALRANRKCGQARKVSEAIIVQHPRDVRCLYGYAELVWQHYDDAENAKVYLRKCIECDPGFAAARAMLAEIKVHEASIDIQTRAKARTDGPGTLRP